MHQKPRWTAEKIKALRLAYGEKQVEFCKRLGVSATALRCWEWDNYCPTGSAELLLDRLQEDLDNRAIRPLAKEPAHVS